MTDPAVIFDIDGTLADLSHRLHLIKHDGKKDYKAFFDSIPMDEPIKPVAWLARVVAVNSNIIFVTGRPDSHRTETLKWLETHLGDAGKNPALYMRKTGDYRTDDIIKHQLLKQIIADGYSPFLVIDDRPRVVEMWRKLGLICLQNAWHEDHFDIADNKNTTILNLMVGPSGAGKSSYLETSCKFSKEDQSGQLMIGDWYIRAHESQIISSDQLRQDICGDFMDQSKNHQVFAALKDLVSTRMKNGLTTFVDATHLNRDDRLEMVGLAPRGSRVRYLVIDRPLEQKLASAGWRKGISVKGKPLVVYHHEKFKQEGGRIMIGDGLPNIDVVDLTT